MRLRATPLWFVRLAASRPGRSNHRPLPARPFPGGSLRLVVTDPSTGHPIDRGNHARIATRTSAGTVR